MCRLFVYRGTYPIQLSHLVTRPRHSITNQAFESQLRLPSSRPMNADGFGIGWYDPLPTSPLHQSSSSSHSQKSSEASVNSADAALEAHNRAFEPVHLDEVVHGLSEVEVKDVLRKREEEAELENERPCVFKSLSPAWSSANLTRLAEKIRSPLVFAHVRASTMSGAPSEDNCHPWVFDRLMWMHNGEISGFTKIKRVLQMSLSEELFLFPQGYTDSEWAFMVFLSKLRDCHARVFTHTELRVAMLETIQYINKLLKEAGVSSPSLMNFVVSDGTSIVATRYISSRTSEASSLFFSSGTSFDETSEPGLYKMTKADKREDIIMIASEPITFERSDWMEVKTNTMVVITPKMNVLQIPIIDEYWVAPQDPAAHNRSRNFAIEMGFGHGFAAMTEVPA